MIEHIWTSLLSLFIIEPFNNLKKRIFDILKLFRTIFKNIKSPGYLLNNSNIDKSKYLNTIDSIRVILFLVFLILTIRFSFKVINTNFYNSLFNEFIIIVVYVISILIIGILGYIWNFTGNFKLEYPSYTTNSLLYLFNSIYFFIFLYSLIPFQRLNDTTSDMELPTGMMSLFWLIALYTIYHFKKENKILKYSKSNIFIFGVIYVLIIWFLSLLNLIILQKIFHNN